MFERKVDEFNMNSEVGFVKDGSHFERKEGSGLSVRSLWSGAASQPRAKEGFNFFQNPAQKGVFGEKNHSPL
jgi:hypothetical protein